MMKRNIFFLALCSMMLLAASCSKDDSDKNNNEEQVEKPDLTYNDAEYLMDVLLNKIGEDMYLPEQGLYTGEGMTELTILTATQADAEQHFRSLAHPDATIVDNKGTLTLMLTDKEGKSQGTAVFTPVADDPYLLAELSLENMEGNASPLRKVRYVTEDGFPVTNSIESVLQEMEEDYYYGAIRLMNDGESDKPYVIIREYQAKGKVAGMALRLYPEKHSVWDGDLKKDWENCPNSLYTLQTVGKILNADSLVMSKALARAGSDTNWKHPYLTKDTYWTGIFIGYCLNPGEDIPVWAGQSEYYKCRVHHFYPGYDVDPFIRKWFHIDPDKIHIN